MLFRERNTTQKDKKEEKRAGAVTQRSAAASRLYLLGLVGGVFDLGGQGKSNAGH